MESLVPLVLLLGVAWLLILRPMRRQRMAQAALKSSLGPGAEIITVGGLHGTVISLDGDDVLLEIAEGVRVRYLQGAIRTVVPPVVEVSEPAERTDTDGLVEPAEAGDPPTD